MQTSSLTRTALLSWGGRNKKEEKKNNKEQNSCIHFQLLYMDKQDCLVYPLLFSIRKNVY